MRSLFVMAARLKASTEGRSLEDMAGLVWLENRDAVRLICSGKSRLVSPPAKSRWRTDNLSMRPGLRGVTGYCSLSHPIVQRKKL